MATGPRVSLPPNRLSDRVESAIQVLMADVESAVEKLTTLATTTKLPSRPASHEKWIAEVNCRVLAEHRKTYYEACLQGPVEQLIHLQGELRRELTSLLPDEGVNLAASLGQFVLSAADLIAPVPSGEDSIALASADDVLKARLEAERIVSAIREAESSIERGIGFAERWMTITELADNFGISRGALQKAIDRGPPKLHDDRQDRRRLQDPASRAPHFMFRLSAVTSIALQIAKRQASRERKKFSKRK